MKNLGEFLTQFESMDLNLPITFSCGIESGRSYDVAMEADCNVTLTKGDVIYHNTEDEFGHEEEDRYYEGLDEDGDEVDGNRMIQGPVIIIKISGSCTSTQ